MRAKRITALLITLALMLQLLPTIALASPEEIVTELQDLTVNYQKDPIGIEQDNIRFGWKMESNLIGQAQTSYQLSLRKNTADGEEVWSSGEVISPLSTAISYSGPELDFETKYYWTVEVTDILDQVHTATASFETGTDWDGAQWITIENYEDTVRTLLFRTEQQLNGDSVASARLYITGLGAYEAYINGRKVQGEVNAIMTPGWTDYSRYIHYQTYDVTDYLPADGGAVALGAIVGSGWYGSKVIVAPKDVGYTGAISGSDLLERALYAKLVITYADQTSQEIVTDADNWKVSPITPYEENGVWEGETYNAQTAKEIGRWNETGYDDDNWEAPKEVTYTGQVYANNSGVVYDYQELPLQSAYTYNEDTDIINVGNPYAKGEIDFSKAVSYTGGATITLKVGDKMIADFGQNAAATISMQVTAPAGTTITMLPSECISDGKDGVYAKGTRIPGALEAPNYARGKFIYIASGDGVESYRGAFHYIGYQYMEITADQDVTFHSLSSIAVSSLTNEAGSIETSSDLLNQFVSSSKWSQVSNYVSVPTDCPTREFYGWSGDAQLFAESGMYHFDSAQFLGNYIDIMNETYQKYGVYTQSMPRPTNSFFSSMQSSGWSDAGVIVPYVYYQYTGDTTLIEKSWASMDKFARALGTNGLSYSLGDWKGITGESASSGFVTRAYATHVDDLMARMAKAVGREDDAQFYATRAGERRERLINSHMDLEAGAADTGSNKNAQTALSWAINLGLHHTQEQKQALGMTLAASVRNEGQSVSKNRLENTLGVGFLGVHVVLPALSEGGQTDAAYDLMMSTNMYSPLYAVTKGANTTWENWTIYTEENGYRTDTESQNHYAYGAASEWLYEYMLGIQKDVENPAFKHFILQPAANAALDYANGSYESYYGKIESGWTVDDGNLATYSAVIPANTTATLYLPVEASAMESFADIAGMTYLGMEEHNGLNTAKFEVLAGGYDFEVVDGTLTASLQDGYVDSGMSFNLLLSTDAYHVEAGDYANITTEFANPVNSNTAIINYYYDTELFEQRDFHAAEGVRVISRESTDDGAKVVVMVADYNTQIYGRLALEAKPDAILSTGRATVRAEAEYVVKNEEGDKFINVSMGSVSFTTYGPGEPDPGKPLPRVKGDTNGDDLVDLIDLSNMIDWFGTDSGDSDWDSWYTYFDFNNNSSIDIYDIVFVAQLIK